MLFVKDNRGDGHLPRGRSHTWFGLVHKSIISMASGSSHGVKDYLKTLMLSLKQHKSCVHGGSDCWFGSHSVVGVTPVPLPEHFLNAF